MKKFYTVIAAALVGATAVASVNKPLLGFGTDRDHKPTATEMQKMGVSSAVNHLKTQAPVNRVKAYADGDQTTTTLVPEITVSEPITEIPEGTTVKYSRDTYGFWVLMGAYIYLAHDYGGAVNLTTTADGTVYMSNPQSQYLLNSYAKGQLSADGTEITFSGAQMVGTETNYGQTYGIYLVPLDYTETNPETGDGFYYPSESGVYKLKKVGDTFEAADKNMVYGICVIDEENNVFSWGGYGDHRTILTPMTETAPTMPEGVTPQEWGVKYASFAHVASAAVQGNKFYIKGLMGGYPDAVAVGDIQGDKITFPAGQFIGLGSDLHYGYLYGARAEMVYDEDYGQEIQKVYATRNTTFDYATGNIKGATGLSIVHYRAADAMKEEDISVSEAQLVPVLRVQERVPMTPPAQATNFSFYGFDDSQGYGYVDFDFYNEDANGCVLPTDKLYYRVFLDGELFIFYPDEYMMLPQQAEYIPFNFYDGYDFGVDGYTHTFYYYADGLDTIGVQTCYDAPEGLLGSNVASFRVAGLTTTDLDANRTVKSVTYYDLQGRTVANPSAGSLYICRTTYTDGTSLTTKVVK